MIYVLCVYNKKEKEHQITVCSKAESPLNTINFCFIQVYVITKFDSQMGAYDIEDALAWKKKIEQIIDQVQ